MTTEAQKEPPAVVPVRAAPIPDLTDDQIVERLEDAEPTVVDDIYGLAKAQLDAEAAHATKLDARATSLFGAAGFSVTVAFSFGGWALLDNVRKVPHGGVIACLFVVVLVIGLASSLFSLRGLLLKSGHKFVDEQDVFNQRRLAEKSQVKYRRYMAAHMWLVWQSRAKSNDRRARTIMRGQRLFGVFLMGILGLSGATTWSAVQRHLDTPSGPIAFEPHAFDPLVDAFRSAARATVPAPPQTSPIQAPPPAPAPAPVAPAIGNKPGHGRPRPGSLGVLK